jgi:hypothetical protein
MYKWGKPRLARSRSWLILKADALNLIKPELHVMVPVGEVHGVSHHHVLQVDRLGWLGVSKNPSIVRLVWRSLQLRSPLAASVACFPKNVSHTGEPAMYYHPFCRPVIGGVEMDNFDNTLMINCLCSRGADPHWSRHV